MKKLITVPVIILASFLNAQDFCPILVAQKMNYKHSDSTIISQTIWVDSVETAGDTLIYHFNKIVKDVPDNTEIVLMNQPQFLLKRMESLNEGVYRFSIPGEFIIKSLAAPGETWIFNPNENITAEVTSQSLDEIFGVQDSVKLISLTDGNEIKLSKSFGILKFPDFENGGYYELAGIQNTGFGESVPNFWDIFDFEPGDVFQTYSYYSDAVNYFITEEWNKSYINSKQVFADHYTYNIYQIRFHIFYGYGGNVAYSHGTYLFDESYYFNDYPFTAKFQNDTIKLLLSCGFTTEPDYYSRVKIYTDANGLINKQWGTLGTGWEDYEELFYQYLSQGDTLNVLNEAECFAVEQGHGSRYTESLGNTFNYYCDHFEVYYFDYLMGYIKDGDTVGIVYSDSALLVGTDLPKSYPGKRVLVYPNPATNTVNFKFVYERFLAYQTIEIANLMGEIVRIEENKGNEVTVLDIGNLNPGIYFYTIKNHNEVIQQGKLVIR